MPEQTDKIQDLKVAGDDVYKQVAPSGLAAEVDAEKPISPETVTALGNWLATTLGSSPETRERVAVLSGIPVSDLTSLIDGHPLFRLDTDHIQKIATALVEAQIIPHGDEVWKAIASDTDASDYIVPPTQILQAMSNT